jgi:hypothetical protein
VMVLLMIYRPGGIVGGGSRKLATSTTVKGAR